MLRPTYLGADGSGVRLLCSVDLYLEMGFGRQVILVMSEETSHPGEPGLVTADS